MALRWVPRDWQGRFRTFDQGPKPGVSLALGAACEGVLSFASNLVVLWSAHTRRAPQYDPMPPRCKGHMHARCLWCSVEWTSTLPIKLALALARAATGIQRTAVWRLKKVLGH